MSRFFRSGDSSSSSDADDHDQADETHSETFEDPSRISMLSLNTYTDERTTDQAPTTWNAHHSHALLHALLEERCLNEVLAANPTARRDAPGIQAEARARYLRLASRLASLNLMSPGFEQDRHTNTRQQYRDGLDMLSRQQSSAAVPGSLRRMLSDTYTDALEYQQPSNRNSMIVPSNRNSMLVPRPQSRRTNDMGLQAPLQMQVRERSAERTDYFESAEPEEDSLAPLGLTQRDIANKYPAGRYRCDFEELRVLGHGGYGIVYHTRNFLDNQSYAVKKIPISAARLRRIKTRGQPELDDILMELRMLARLHHPNIVRYFSAWIEWADATPRRVGFTGEDSTSETANTGEVTTGAEEDPFSRSLQRISTISGASGILFEESGVIEKSEGHSSSIATEDESDGINPLQRMGTKSTAATVSDDDSTSAAPFPEVSASIHSIGGGAHFAEPTLAIHLQMSLHPMTLADFLVTEPATTKRTAVPHLRHCFHLEPAVSIVLAVFEGLEYLHSEGIVHRDMKPANIFLSPNNRAKSGRTSVDLMQCVDCPGHGAPGTMMLDVCIGDFGLAVVADSKSPAGSEAAVGTEIYRPDTKDTRSASLDVYALGIVFFELLWKFGTRMERYYTIRDLKEGKYPDGFCERVGRGRGVAAMECIDQMLCYDEQAVSIQELKERLRLLVSRL